MSLTKASGVAGERDMLLEANKRLQKQLDIERYENIRLQKLINTALTDKFWDSVQMEAVYQHERWYKEDSEKVPQGWLWTIVYLAAKAFFSQVNMAHARFTSWNICEDACNRAYFKVLNAEKGEEKIRHRIITVAAATYHWFNLWDKKL